MIAKCNGGAAEVGGLGMAREANDSSPPSGPTLCGVPAAAAWVLPGVVESPHKPPKSRHFYAFQRHPELATWRSTVRDFVKTNWETEPEGDEMAMMEGGGNQAKVSKWLDKLAERGWIAPAWPKEYGGAGLSVLEQFILNEEFAEAARPTAGGC